MISVAPSQLCHLEAFTNNTWTDEHGCSPTKLHNWPTCGLEFWSGGKWCSDPPVTAEAPGNQEGWCEHILRTTTYPNIQHHAKVETWWRLRMGLSCLVAQGVHCTNPGQIQPKTVVWVVPSIGWTMCHPCLKTTKEPIFVRKKLLVGGPHGLLATIQLVQTLER